MKRIFVILAVMTAFTAMTPSPASAQVRVSVNIDIQPAWGPVGYDYAEYYYLPDIDIYYYIPTRMYVYFDGWRWIHTRYLPHRYAHYDFYRGYKVVINQRDPWRYHDRYRRQYAHYRNNHTQVVLRDRGHYTSRPRPADRRVYDRDNNRRDWDNNRGNGQREWNNNRGNGNNDRGNDRREWDNNRGNGNSDRGNARPGGNERREWNGNRGNGNSQAREWKGNSGNRGSDRKAGADHGNRGNRGNGNGNGRDRK